MRMFADAVNAPVRIDPVLAACGAVSLVIWLVALFAPDLSGRFGDLILKPDAVPDAGPVPVLFLLFVPYVVACVRVGRSGRNDDRAVIVGFAVAFCLVALAKIAPLASFDAYLYAFQGRAGALFGMNPYDVVPADVADPTVVSMGTWLSGLKNAYGPLWTSATVAVAKVVGDRPTLMLVSIKLLAATCFLACAPLAASLRAASGAATARAGLSSLLLVAWNPVLIYEFAQNGHNDSMMIMFLLVALLLLARGKPALAGFAFAASFLTKYVTIALLPVLLAHLWRRPGGARAVVAFSCAALVATFAAYAPYWFGPATLDGVAAQAALAGTDVLAPMPFFLGLAWSGYPADMFPADVLADARFASLAAFGTLLVALTARAAFRKQAPSPVVDAVTVLVAYVAIASAWVMPWYLTWPIPFLVALGTPVAVVIAGLAALLLYGHHVAFVLVAALLAAALAPTITPFLWPWSDGTAKEAHV